MTGSVVCLLAVTSGSKSSRKTAMGDGRWSEAVLGIGSQQEHQ